VAGEKAVFRKVEDGDHGRDGHRDHGRAAEGDEIVTGSYQVIGPSATRRP